MPLPNYLDILNVEKAASKDLLVAAYTLHLNTLLSQPASTQLTDQLHKLVEAYTVLSTPTLETAYEMVCEKESNNSVNTSAHNIETAIKRMTGVDSLLFLPFKLIESYQEQLKKLITTDSAITQHCSDILSTRLFAQQIFATLDFLEYVAALESPDKTSFLKNFKILKACTESTIKAFWVFCLSKMTLNENIEYETAFNRLKIAHFSPDFSDELYSKQPELARCLIQQNSFEDLYTATLKNNDAKIIYYNIDKELHSLMCQKILSFLDKRYQQAQYNKHRFLTNLNDVITVIQAEAPNQVIFPNIAHFKNHLATVYAEDTMPGTELYDNEDSACQKLWQRLGFELSHRRLSGSRHTETTPAPAFYKSWHTEYQAIDNARHRKSGKQLPLSWDNETLANLTPLKRVEYAAKVMRQPRAKLPDIFNIRPARQGKKSGKRRRKRPVSNYKDLCQAVSYTLVLLTEAPCKVSTSVRKALQTLYSQHELVSELPPLSQQYLELLFPLPRFRFTRGSVINR